MNLKRIMLGKRRQSQKVTNDDSTDVERQNYKDREQVSGCQGQEGGESLNTKGQHQGIWGVNCSVP